jgi:membrane-anchored glycerophosphoryl diester phosphodiesterase (GDPDase)
MTKAGDALLNEYLNERNEAFEDEKRRLNWQQCLHASGGVKRLSILAVNLYFLSWLVIGVLALLLMGEADVAAMRTATDTDLIKGIQALNMLALFVAFAGTLVFSIVRARFYFRNAKNEWIEAENRQAEEIKNIVLISEELLRRHKLLAAEDTAQ